MTDPNPDKQFLKDTHKVKLAGIFTKYARRIMLWSYAFWGSLGLTIIAGIFLLISRIDYFSYLQNTVEITISILPAIVGFCIGGYALIIGFGQKDVLTRMSQPLGEAENWMSYYQVLSSVFAISIIIQILTLLICVVISYVGNLNLSSSYADEVNISGILLCIFSSLYSIWLTYYVVKNIFIFGQMMHFCIRKEELDKRDVINKDDISHEKS